MNEEPNTDPELDTSDLVTDAEAAKVWADGVALLANIHEEERAKLAKPTWESVETH